MNNKFISGQYKTYFYKKEFEYNSFVPSLLNKSFYWENKKIDILLEEANELLGRLDSCALLVPDINSYIRMHITKEATISTRIEGTKTDIDEAVLQKKDISPEKRNDWIEVQNYITAINYSIRQLEKLPLSMRLLKDTHKFLLQDVRGQERLPGEIRTTQNWIGENIKNAYFVPPHPEILPDLLSDLEKFWYNEDILVPRLIKVALTHYQFETIHPFCDGNGRIGRLLITLQLINYKILRKPILYISDYFEKNKGLYYDALTITRQTNNIEQWIIFFLSGIINSSKKGAETFEKIIKLRLRYEDIIRNFGRQAPIGQKLLIYLFSHPIIDIPLISKRLNIVYNTSSSIIKKMVAANMLRPIKTNLNKNLFVLYEYFNLYRE
jgi:Fic family protein